MGFGSYDESEQEQRQRANDSDEGNLVSTSEEDHHGEIEYEMEENTEELLDKLEQIKTEDT